MSPLTTRVHKTAIVAPQARIADDVEIGPFCVVGPDAEIGPGNRLFSRVVIAGRVKIGARNEFHPTVVIGGAPQDERPAAPDGRIEIGNDNRFRESVTVNLPKMQGGVTRIGSHNRLEFGAHVGHDAQVGNHVTLSMLSLLAGHTLIGDQVHLEPMVAVHQFVTMGRYSRLRKHGAISEDAPPYLEYEGTTNRPCGVNRTGLEKSGLSETAIAALEEALRVVWRSGLPRPEALTRLESSPVPEVAELVRFLRQSTQGRFGRAREALRHG